MTIQKAREILGKKAEKLPDNRILDVLNMLRFICNKAIDQALFVVSEEKKSKINKL